MCHPSLILFADVFLNGCFNAIIYHWNRVDAGARENERYESGKRQLEARFLRNTDHVRFVLSMRLSDMPFTDQLIRKRNENDDLCHFC